jgi:pilus assembly protein Flp/PilA
MPFQAVLPTESARAAATTRNGRPASGCNGRAISKEFLMKYVGYLKRFLRDEDGVTAIEYGLIAALIAVAIIAGVEAVGGGVSGVFDKVSLELKDAVPAPATP